MKLSIITINLNNKDGLHQTIDSVINQTFTGYEFIIIDGNSNDGSLDVIKEYEDKLAYWISEPDKGIYNAMNKGIMKAKGEYLYFLNTGDRLVADNVLESIFKGNPNDSFICGNFIKETGNTLIKDDSYKYRYWTDSLYDLYSDNLCHQAFFIRSDNFTKYGLYDETMKITADWKLFFIAIGLKHESVLYKDVDVVIYNMEGLSSTIGGEVISKEKRKVFEDYLPKSLIDRYDKLYALENNAYIIDFVQSGKWIYYSFHAFRKIVRKLGLSSK